MSDLFKTLTSLATQNLKIFRSRAKNQRIFTLEGMKFFRVGFGSFRNVWAVWVDGKLQEFVIKVNRTKFNSNSFEYQNYLMFKEVGLDCHLVPCLYFQEDILFMKKVTPCQDFLGSRDAAHHIVRDIKKMFCFNTKQMKKYKSLSEGLDIRKVNMSSDFLILDYGIPLMRIN
jgi:hypothetical protein